jgi:hypothetical protein
MFHELSLTELKELVKDLRAHHNIRGYSRMKKESLVAELDARFVLRDGNLYLKEDVAPRTFTPKIKPPRSDKKKELERNIYQYLSGLSNELLRNASPDELREEFETLAGIKTGSHKTLFRKLTDEVLLSRKR